MDSNFPHLVLATASLIRAAAGRVVAENLAVEPGPGLKTFETQPGRLCLPDFDFVGGELLEEAVTRGVESEVVREYLDSLFAFASGHIEADSEEGRAIQELRTPDGRYRSTEAEVCRTNAETIGEEEGLALVLEACDRLEGHFAEREVVLRSCESSGSPT